MKQPIKTHMRLFAVITAGVLLLSGLGIYSLVARLRKPSISGGDSEQVVSVKGASVDFGCLLDENDEVIIKKVKPAEIDSGVEIYAYDFQLSSGQPDGVIEIAISYSDKGLQEEDEKRAICGKYLNEETGEWEDVFYTVDPDSNTVRILTDHLSIYGVFKVTDPAKRSAYISEVSIYAAGCMTTKQAQIILECYAGQGPTWKEDVAGATIEALGSYPYFAATSVPTLLSLGGAYDSIFSSSFNNSLNVLGVSTACAQFAFDAYYNGLSSKEASLSGMKTVLDLALNFTAPSIQLAYISVGAIDLALTEVSTFAVSNKYKSTKHMYDAYYRRSGINRKAKDWFTLFEKMYKENKYEPQKVLEMMEAEIDRYVQEYWTVAGTDWESWIDSYDKNGSLSKYPWPSAKDRNNISSIFKSELYEYLRCVFQAISRNMYLDSLTERQKDYQKVADLYNRKFSLVIREDIPSGKSSTWAGCYARLAPLSNNTDPSAWTGKLNNNGGGRMNFTLLAHQIAGFPMKLELYKTAADVKAGKKLHTVTLPPFSETEQTVILEPRPDFEEPKPADEDPESDENTPPELPVTQPPHPEENPWYDITIKATDNSKVFSGWFAVLQYPKNSYPDLKDMYKDFNSKGECVLYFQKSDYDGLDSPSQIWLYKDKTDLLNKLKPDQIVNFSLGSASRAGERYGEPLYKLIVKAKPPGNKPDILESITGDYTSYMIHEEFFTEGLPEKQVEDYDPGEKPSGNVNLHYNGPSLTLIAAADPYHTARVLDKITGYRYERTENNTCYRIEILTAGENAKLYISTESPGYELTQVYILTKKN